MYGFPKTKNQDIIIEPPQANVSVGPVMALNVRSQLSSIQKNYDTMFERVFAEALTLHNRFPHMVLGYLYLIPTVGYDSDAAKQRQITLSERYNLQKYILSFSAITGRSGPTDVAWKYERLCLLIADFEKNPPTIMGDMRSLLSEGLVTEEFSRLYSFDNLAPQGFFDELYKTMMERYYQVLL